MTTAIRIALLVSLFVMSAVSCGGGGSGGRVESLSTEPFLHDSPVPAEVTEDPTVFPAETGAFGVMEEFHRARVGWRVDMALGDTAAGWVDAVVDDDWRDVAVSCHAYADGARGVIIKARKQDSYTMHISVEMREVATRTTNVSVIVSVPFEGKGSEVTDAAPDSACLSR